ncbi:fimbrial protein [Enterobacter sp. CC120223-11]|uniref:fimbrial protein n=1 Tax=Enterobacter sp. CC120223-11 TaxID=1378073 RepID=UPI000BCAFC90|nr:fimbrial protein [Enterobacter sp. CC120223-11]SNY75315.1 Pilin (type 1 fimbria component protein) [Enterobacter sp. CC120223-11]
MKALSTYISGGGLLVLISASPVKAAENVHLHGTLVSEPCKIATQGDTLMADFGGVPDKYLYLNQRTHGQMLRVDLVDCNISISKSVKITINGIGNGKLPGLLALNQDSTATGILIGFESTEGQPLPLNEASNTFPLQNGASSLAIKTYIQAEPDALKNKTIGRGEFNAIATFRLDYP